MTIRCESRGWVVLAKWHGAERIVFGPVDNIFECIRFAAKYR